MTKPDVKASALAGLSLLILSALVVPVFFVVMLMTSSMFRDWDDKCA